MKAFYTIGIDIGGTNTDAVLVGHDQKIVAATKTPTTGDIVTGLLNALQKILQTVEPEQIQAIFLGTTHATNAILQKKDLHKVGLIRIAGHYPKTIPPCFDWPEDLTRALYAGSVTVGGGFECDGREISPFSTGQVERAIDTLLSQGTESFAVIGVFSPQNGSQETQTAHLIAQRAGESFPVSLSHQIGGVGFIERENSTILNAALKKVMEQGFHAVKEVLAQLKLHCPLYITQNNGTVIDLAQALAYPVLTISAGPTNSFIGASSLTGITEALIIDIGGTSTDIGLIQKGFPRRSLNTSNIGGVQLNFPMPDVLSLAIGGGSHISLPSLQIGPASVGREILSSARCFGGDILTLTDAAVSYGVPIAGSVKTKPCTQEEGANILKAALKRIKEELLILEGGKEELPILFVGGGASLLPKELLDARFLIPEHSAVANAYGAALAKISGTIDRVVSLTQREATLDQLEREATEAAIHNGADSATVAIVDLQIIPYHYAPDHMARVIVTAAGNWKQDCSK